MSLRNIKNITDRRNFIKKEKRIVFKAITCYPKEMEQAQTKNCENMIGAIQVPVGVAGPLLIKGNSAKGKYFIPLSTTEGALVASVNRGCKAITNSGGVVVKNEYVGMTRGSVFAVSDLSQGFEFKKWLESYPADFSEICQTTSRHLKILKIDSKVVGRNVFVRFYFDTLDAMGMNMVTLAVQKIIGFIEKHTDTKCISIAGNYDVDKKPSWQNFILGRGRQVWAEAVISDKEMKDTLKTTPDKIHKVCLNKCMLGSILSGPMGFNAHFANIIAAVFLACGQDMAHVVEGSLGITSTEIIDRKLYISIYLPDLPVGTVGGGTYLPSQKEMLQLLGIFGGKGGENATAFAEIIGACVLAGELSLLSSLAEGSLARAHMSLGRGGS